MYQEEIKICRFTVVQHTHTYHVITEKNKSTTTNNFHSDGPMMHCCGTHHVFISAPATNNNDTYIMHPNATKENP